MLGLSFINFASCTLMWIVPEVSSVMLRRWAFLPLTKLPGALVLKVTSLFLGKGKAVFGSRLVGPW